MKSSHEGSTAAKAVEYGADEILPLDQPPVTTSGRELPGVNEIKQTSADQSLAIKADRATPPTMIPVQEVRNIDDDSKNIGVQAIRASQGSGRLEVIIRIPKGLDDPEAGAAMALLMAQATSANGIGSPSDCIETNPSFPLEGGGVLSYDASAGFPVPLLNLSILSLRQAVLSSENDDTQLQTGLYTLGLQLLTRAEILDSTSDIDSAIECLTRASAIEQGGHFSLIDLWSVLSRAYTIRFKRIGRLDDITSAITCQHQILALAGDKHEKYAWILGDLGDLYQWRYGTLSDICDINRAIDYQTKSFQLFAVGQEERIVVLMNLGVSYGCRFDHLGELEDLCKAIECQTQAAQLAPEGHRDMHIHFSNLGASYSSRFARLGDTEDINKAIGYHSQALRLAPGGHENVPLALNNLGSSYMSRYERLGNIEDINEAIEFQIQAVQVTPERHPSMPKWLSNLGTSAKNAPRFST